MKKLTPKDIANLQLEEDEAILVSVSGGRLNELVVRRIVDFIESCRKGEAPVGLIIETEPGTTIDVSVIKASEVTTNMILLESKESPVCDPCKPGSGVDCYMVEITSNHNTATFQDNEGEQITLNITPSDHDRFKHLVYTVERLGRPPALRIQYEGGWLSSIVCLDKGIDA